MTGLDRLAVFIDHQNAYRGARQAVGATETDHHVIGQYDPIKLAKLIAAHHPSYPGAKLRKLVQVQIYSGLPSSSKNSRGYGAARKQFSRWKASASSSGPKFEVGSAPGLIDSCY